MTFGRHSLRDGARLLKRGAREAILSLPHTARPATVRVSAYCVYRAKNATIVRRWLDALPQGSEVHLHALDEVPASLAFRTRSRGPGLRMPLLQSLIDTNPPHPGDYVMIIDDDVILTRRGARRFPGLAARGSLDISQPAHGPRSTRTFGLNGASPLVTARLTRYVEVGPVVLFSPQALSHVLPFPADARMGWGLDVLWSQLAADGIRLGIVDAVQVVHLGPVGSAYDMREEHTLLQRALDAVNANSIHDVVRAVPGPVWRPWQRTPPWLRDSASEGEPGASHG